MQLRIGLRGPCARAALATLVMAASAAVATSSAAASAGAYVTRPFAGLPELWTINVAGGHPDGAGPGDAMYTGASGYAWAIADDGSGLWRYDRAGNAEHVADVAGGIIHHVAEDGSSALVGNTDGVFLHRMNPEGGTMSSHLDEIDDCGSSPESFSPNLSFVAVWCGASSSPTTHSPLYTYETTSGDLTPVVLPPNAMSVLYEVVAVADTGDVTIAIPHPDVDGSGPGTTGQVWRVPFGGQPQLLAEHPGGVTVIGKHGIQVQFFHGGLRVATAENPGTVFTLNPPPFPTPRGGDTQAANTVVLADGHSTVACAYVPTTGNLVQKVCWIGDAATGVGEYTRGPEEDRTDFRTEQGGQFLLVAADGTQAYFNGIVWPATGNGQWVIAPIPHALRASARVCFGVAGEPGDVAVVNLTPVEAVGAGYGQLVSSDVVNPPVASNVNFAPGTVDPNIALAPIGSDGKVCYVNSPLSSVHLVADHLGTVDGDAYTPAATSGAPDRKLDTRI